MIRVIMGSKSDKEKTNWLLEVLLAVGVTYVVSCASCHRHSGGKERKFEKLVASIPEQVIIMIGALSLQAVAMIETHLRNQGVFNKIVIGVPLDEHALDAIQALPKGTSVLTSGYNSSVVKHGVINAALAAAKLELMLSGNLAIDSGLRKWYAVAEKENPFKEEVPLQDGLIP